jgi:hypothetical protein
MVWGCGAAFAGLMALQEWIRWAGNLPYYPWAWTVTAVAIGCLATWKIRVALRELEMLKLGLLGERFVGHFLQNKLLRRGYWIVHDLCDEDFNVDHAIIGPGGVFAIETKMRRKPKGDARIDYDGQQVLVAGHKPDRDPVAQAQAASKWLSRVLLEKTGISIHVQPVVLFPGWYVNPPPGNVETWVLNENYFVDRLDSQPVRLTHEQIFLLASSLGRHVLEQDERRK